jgi:hypothetical protein
VQRVELPIVLSEANGVVGFAITVRFDPSGTRVIDAEPALPGTQAADVGTLPHGAFVAANDADHERGRIHIALVGLDPASTGASVLARVLLEIEHSSGMHPRVTALQIAGEGGARIPTRLEVGGFVVAPAYHVWLPLLSRDRPR